MTIKREDIDAYFATDDGKKYKDELGAPLKATNQQLKTEKTDLKTRFDVQATELADLIKNPKTVEKLVGNDATATQKLIDDAVKLAVGDITTASKDKLDAADVRVANLQRNAIGATLSAEITKELQAQGGNVSLLDRHIAARVKAEIGEDGVVKLTPLKADGKDMYDENGIAPLSKLVSEFKADKVFASAFNVKVPSGSGHQQGGDGAAGAYDLQTGKGNLGAFLTGKT